MSDDDLCYLSAADALTAFRRRTLSPVELMTALIHRSQREAREVNAFAHERFEQALREAQKSAERIARGDWMRPLEGLPVAVKMDAAIAGDPASFGCSAFADQVAERTDPVVERILEAGGIVHARTTMPEFAGASFTHSSLWGTTRNPWNLEYSPGGSSGGSAAALAAGIAALATGSDNAGSIRMPASFCGVVGYKPPYGRVPSAPPLNRDTYFSNGSLARNVRDTQLLLDAIAGLHPDDPFSLPAFTVDDGVTSGRGLRIAVSADLGGFPVEPEIKATTLSCASRLKEIGATVEEVDIDWDWREVIATGRRHLEMTVGRMAARAMAQFPSDLMPYTASFVASIDEPGSDDVLENLERETAIEACLRSALERFDVLMCPTQGHLGFRAGEDYVDVQPVINQKVVRYPFETHMGLPFNITGTRPVLSMPSGMATTGIPTGIQIVGRPYDEETVFVIGQALEMLTPELNWFSDASSRPL